MSRARFTNDELVKSGTKKYVRYKGVALVNIQKVNKFIEEY